MGIIVPFIEGWKCNMFEAAKSRITTTNVSMHLNTILYCPRSCRYPRFLIVKYHKYPHIVEFAWNGNNITSATRKSASGDIRFFAISILSPRAGAQDLAVNQYIVVARLKIAKSIQKYF